MGEKTDTVILDISGIQKILPHRYPFLLVDKVIELEEDKRIVAVKNVTANEPFFPGHFPGSPIMPGVLIMEALAQTAGILFMQSIQGQNKLPFFMSMDSVKFRNPVRPGSVLRLEVDVIRKGDRFSKVKGTAVLEDGKVAAQGELMAGLVDADQ